MVVQHHAQRRHQGGIILQRLPHAHHHHVGDHAFARRRAQARAQRVLGMPELGQDLARAQVATEPLVPGGTEAAAHGAAGLRRDAQGAPVVLGNEDRFHRIACADVEQPLDGTVSRLMFAHHRQQGQFTTTGQLLAQRAREVGHDIEVARALLVDPAEQLDGAETLLTQAGAECRQPVEVEVEQVDGAHRASRFSRTCRSVRLQRL